MPEYRTETMIDWTTLIGHTVTISELVVAGKVVAIAAMDTKTLASTTLARVVSAVKQSPTKGKEAQEKSNGHRSMEAPVRANSF